MNFGSNGMSGKVLPYLTRQTSSDLKTTEFQIRLFKMDEMLKCLTFCLVVLLTSPTPPGDDQIRAEACWDRQVFE